MDTIRVFAPATVANVASGFDIFGLAVEQPGDEVILKRRTDNQIRIVEINGDQSKLSFDPNKNTVTVPIFKYLEKLDQKVGLDIILNKKMPLGSGLGSSSASSVAGVFALNHMLNQPMSKADLLPFAMEGERIACGSAHADNVAPALLGGFVVIRSYAPLDFFRISDLPSDLFVTIVHPDVEVNTKDARKILRPEVSLTTTIAQMGNVAGTVYALMTADYHLLGRSMQDLIIEPHRAILIPYFFEVKEAALKNGAIGCSISGAGPSIFAFSRGGEAAQCVAQAMKKIFENNNIVANAFVSQINQKGPIILD